VPLVSGAPVVVVVVVVVGPPVLSPVVITSKLWRPPHATRPAERRSQMERFGARIAVLLRKECYVSS
jgi:hypothetical protein